jgi:hypothetical protein
MVHGQNPYDLRAVHALEIAAGRNPGEPVLVMRNPPVAFFMALPFAWMGPKAGVIVWMFFLLGALGLASRLIWQINGRPDTLLNFFGFGFAPSLACLMAGQCGILLLLGIALFLFFLRERPFLAGAALLLCALKPHFFAPFGLLVRDNQEGLSHPGRRLRCSDGELCAGLRHGPACVEPIFGDDARGRSAQRGRAQIECRA